MEYVDKAEDIQELLGSLKDSSSILNVVNDNYKPLFNGDELLSDEEVGNYFGIKKRTLIEYRNKRLIAYYKIEGKIRYKRTDIEKFLQERYYKALDY